MNPPSQQLAVDIGNTSLKIAHVSGDSPLVVIALDQLPDSSLAEKIGPVLPRLPATWYVSSVNSACESALCDYVYNHRQADRFVRLTYDQLPLVVNLPHPALVGIDRLLAAVAVEARKVEDQPALVIDAGTAITVDFISPGGVFEGGAIIASPRCANQGLHLNTALPLLATDLSLEPAVTIGKSTNEAIHSGLYWGMIGGIRELIDRISEPWSPSPEIFITGGSAGNLIPRLGHAVTWIPNMVMEGIARTVAVSDVTEWPAGNATPD